MSKHMDEPELLTHCRSAITAIDETLIAFAKSPVEKIRKRAMLISYWFKSYVYFLKNEDNFNPESVFRLKRGSIIQAEFGYRVGRELGGRHYAVVVDANNSIYRNTVTVVPLGSAKKDRLENQYNILLSDGIYGPISRKLMALIEDATNAIREAQGMESNIQQASESERPVLKAIQRQKVSVATQQIEQAKAWLSEIARMKPGSVAKTDQIVTISKMRISNPVRKTHPLYGVRLTDFDMDKIDDSLKNLYFNSQKKE